MKALLTLTLLAHAMVLLFAGVAIGDNVNPVLDDWRADGALNGTYSVEQLREARRSVPAAELEYSSLSSELDASIAHAVARESRTQAAFDGAARRPVPWLYVLSLFAGLMICAHAALVPVGGALRRWSRARGSAGAAAADQRSA